MFTVSIKKIFVIPKFINQIFRSQNLSVFGDGSQVRSFCNVEDAVRGLLLVMIKGKKNETYNVGNNREPISILNLAKKLKSYQIKKGKLRLRKLILEKAIDQR